MFKHTPVLTAALATVLMAAPAFAAEQASAPAAAPAAAAQAPTDPAGPAPVAPAAVPAPQTAAQVAAAEKKDPVICQRQQEIGSLLHAKKVCMPKSQWEAQRQIDRSNIERSQIQRGMDPVQ